MCTFVWKVVLSLIGKTASLHKRRHLVPKCPKCKARVVEAKNLLDRCHL